MIGVDDWKIVSKLPEFPGIGKIATWIEEQVHKSLKRLKVSRLKGLLLHRPNQLLEQEGKSLWRELQNLKKAGIIEKIGFSIYDPCELDILWPSYPPDLVQAPFNILDRRLLTSGWLKHMNDDGVEVHIRSVFLQGLLLMSDSDRPKKFDQWSNIWNIWNTWLHHKEITALQACLSFVMTEPYINRVIVGVENLQQLDEILCSTEINIQEYPQELETDDVNLINPSHWNSL